MEITFKFQTYLECSHCQPPPADASVCSAAGCGMLSGNRWNIWAFCLLKPPLKMWSEGAEQDFQARSYSRRRTSRPNCRWRASASAAWPPASTRRLPRLRRSAKVKAERRERKFSNPPEDAPSTHPAGCYAGLLPEAACSENPSFLRTLTKQTREPVSMRQIRAGSWVKNTLTSAEFDFYRLKENERH